MRRPLSEVEQDMLCGVLIAAREFIQTSPRAFDFQEKRKTFVDAVTALDDEEELNEVLAVVN